MNKTSTGALINTLRIERGLTQRELAKQLNVSDKTISKWECDAGLPDVALLANMANVLGVDIERLLSGELAANDIDGGNMKHVDFYVCPDCGGILTATSKAEISCCGRKLTALQANHADEEHHLTIDCSDHDWYVSFPHEMTKEHFISFIACVSFDTVLIKRLYPEQGSETYLPRVRGGNIYSHCSKHGLMIEEVPT